MNNKIKSVDLVKAILESHPKARNSDNLLYQYVMNHFGVSVKTPFVEVCNRISNGELPSMWTIERARRKAQELYPELAPSEAVKELKNLEESEFVEMSRMKK